MNSSIYSADRATHLRIVAIALAGSIAFLGFSVSVRLDAVFATTTSSVEAGKLRGLQFTGQDDATWMRRI